MAFKEFNLNQFKILFVLEIGFTLISVDLSPHEFKVLSFAKLQITDCPIIMNILLVNILNKSEPNIDPNGIASLIFGHLL